jgi:hypothetical protein
VACVNGHRLASTEEEGKALMPLHELVLLAQNHGLTIGESWALIGYVWGACFVLMWVFKVALDRLEDWRASRRRARDVAELLAAFPVQSPVQEKQIFEALMSISRPKASVVPFPNQLPRI